MAETEVETILREIRERVLAQERAGQNLAARNSLVTSGDNGAGEPGSPRPIARSGDNETLAGGNLSLINSYLATTARAWDRLPPVVSNRTGLVAHVELWMKRHLRRATRWYSWEQINFNAATHHALRDLLPVLAANEAELRKLRAQLAASEAREETRANEFAQSLSAKSNELEEQARANEARNSQVDAKLAALVNELRERCDRLQDEQRVCYKQLAIETTEAAVLDDRARRRTEALLEELARRVEQLESRK